MAVSTVANLDNMLTTAHGAINRHPKGTTTKGLIITHLLVELHRTRLRRTRVMEEFIV
jgi:hypothetical protein